MTSNIIIDEKAKLPLTKSFSMELTNDKYAIAIDSRRMTAAEKITHLAHEMGHCRTGAFYSPYTPLNTRGRCEYRANVWAIKKFLPREAMEEAMKSGAVELWQLAEHFGVTEELVKFACMYYFNKEA